MDIKKYVEENNLAHITVEQAESNGFLKEQEIQTSYGTFKFFYANPMDFQYVKNNMTKLPYSGEYFKDLPEEIKGAMLFNKNWLDIGANQGWFSIKVASIFHPNVIVAIEPYLPTYSFLEKNCQSNKPNIITIRNAVVADDSKEVDFYVAERSASMNSILNINGRQCKKVPAVNVNELIKKYNANFIKMDIEGYEYTLLPTIDFSNIDLLILEYHFRYLKGKEKFEETIKLLQNNFQIVKFDPSMKAMYSTNVICYNKRIFTIGEI